MTAEQMDNYRAMVRELLELDHGLTDWEIGFLDNLNNWQGNYTWKQVGTLERIYQRVK